MSDVWMVVIFSAVAYIYLFIISMILGKKQLSQLTFIDYVVGISIGSIAAQMATETDKPFYHYLIAMGIFFLLDVIITYFGRKGAILKKITMGTPQIIISDGVINYKKLKKSKLTVEELCGMARDKGYFHLEDIAYAIFETSGGLSVLPKGSQKPVVLQDMNIAGEKALLDQYYVIDGSISKESLVIMNKDEKWLLDGLNVQSEAQLDNILLAYFDEKEQNFVVHYKEYQQQ